MAGESHQGLERTRAAQHTYVYWPSPSDAGLLPSIQAITLATGQQAMRPTCVAAGGVAIVD